MKKQVDGYSKTARDNEKKREQNVDRRAGNRRRKRRERRGSQGDKER